MAAELGIDMFDECSFIPNQLMYWPTCPSNGEYICEFFDGELLDPDKILAAHPNWQDCSLLPTTSRESKVSKPSQKPAGGPARQIRRGRCLLSHLQHHGSNRQISL
jgi:hypothetical protein